MSEDYIQAPPDSTGKKLRTRKNIVNGNEVHSEVMVIEDGNGNIIRMNTIENMSVRSNPTTKEIYYKADGSIDYILKTDTISNEKKKLIFSYDGSGNLIKIEEVWL
jgi:hypothetical protein